MLKSQNARNPDASETQLLEQPHHVLSADSSEPLEVLSRPYPRSAYQALLASKPNQLPEYLELPNRRRPALEKALAFAFSDHDPVRQLIIFVRAYVLRKSGPEYAQEVGLKSNSYSQLEARGFDPNRSVASSFGCFLRDWEKRAEETPQAASFFRWAQQRLERLLVGPELGTPLGFLLARQNRAGKKNFADATGLKPETLSTYRSLNKNITFAELVGVIEALSMVPKPQRSAAFWDSPLVKDARRVFFHQSLQLGRPASAIKVHMLLTWGGVQVTSPGLRRQIPLLTDGEAGKIVRFEFISSATWEKLREVKGLVKLVSASFVASIDEAIKREGAARVVCATSTILAVDLMRAQRLSNKHIARIAGIYDPKRSREGTALVRTAIFDKVASPLVPWGALAALLSRDMESFQKLVSSREAEFSSEYRRRSGHPIGTATLAKKIWGEVDALATHPPEALEGLNSAHTKSILTRFLRPFVSGVPSATIGAMVEVRGLLPMWRRAHSSPERFSGIMSEKVVPSYPEYVRLLRAGYVKVNHLHEVGWRHAFGAYVRNHEGGDLFGAMQRRVLKTLLSEAYESRSDALTKGKRAPSTFAPWFQALDKQGSVPRAVWNRMLDLIGVVPGSGRRSTVDSLLTIKEYPAAIREWFVKGMGGLTDAEQRDVAHLMQVGPQIHPKCLFGVAESGGELLEIVHGLKDGSITAMSLSRKRTLRGVLTVMKMFPGATLDDVREVFDKEGKIVRIWAESTTVPASWVPRFDNYSDKMLIEQGILEARTTQNFVPSGIFQLRTRLQRALGDDVERSSFLAVLYPPERGAIRGDSDQLVEIVRQLLNHASGFINLDNAQKKQLFDTFKESMSGAPTFLDARLKIGAFLSTLGGSPERKTLSAHEALDRLLTFLAFS